MAEVVDEHLAVRPGQRLRAAVPQVPGWRQAGVMPDVHHGIPSPWLTLIVTLHDALVIASYPTPVSHSSGTRRWSPGCRRPRPW